MLEKTTAITPTVVMTCSILSQKIRRNQRALFILVFNASVFYETLNCHARHQPK